MKFEYNHKIEKCDWDKIICDSICSYTYTS